MRERCGTPLGASMTITDLLELYRSCTMAEKYHTPSKEARSVAEKCKKLRQEKGWSIEVAAEKVDISVDAYKDAESARHEPSIRKVIALARAFNVAVSYLLGENAFISEEVYEAYYALGKVLGIK